MQKIHLNTISRIFLLLLLCGGVISPPLEAMFGRSNSVSQPEDPEERLLRHKRETIGKIVRPIIDNTRSYETQVLLLDEIHAVYKLKYFHKNAVLMKDSVPVIEQFLRDVRYEWQKSQTINDVIGLKLLFIREDNPLAFAEAVHTLVKKFPQPKLTEREKWNVFAKKTLGPDKHFKVDEEIPLEAWRLFLHTLENTTTDKIQRVNKFLTEEEWRSIKAHHKGIWLPSVIDLLRGDYLSVCEEETDSGVASYRSSPLEMNPGNGAQKKAEPQKRRSSEDSEVFVGKRKKDGA